MKLREAEALIAQGNWAWRMRGKDMNAALAELIAALNKEHGRFD